MDSFYPRIMVFGCNDFPDTSLAGEDGLLAVGGSLTPEMIIKAYRKGIFPWSNEGMPLMWYTPDPRCILLPEEFHLSRTMKQCIKKGQYRCSINEDFEAVIRACGTIERKNQEGTWIYEELISAYTALHRMGLAWSVETWLGDTLAGGLYGVKMGSVFFGESMFHFMPDASKLALYTLVKRSSELKIRIIDCQVESTHLLSLGAKQIPRLAFEAKLAELIPDDYSPR